MGLKWLLLLTFGLGLHEFKTISYPDNRDGFHKNSKAPTSERCFTLFRSIIFFSFSQSLSWRPIPLTEVKIVSGLEIGTDSKKKRSDLASKESLPEDMIKSKKRWPWKSKLWLGCYRTFNKALAGRYQLGTLCIRDTDSGLLSLDSKDL